MRSHPYTAPPPLPPILDEIAAMLPNQSPGRALTTGDGEIALSNLDPETSQLLPTRRKRHHVRVQGRLALVRSISTANLRAGTTTSNKPSADPTGARFESAVGSAVTPRQRTRHQRRSLDERRLGDDTGSDSETEEDERETVRRDRQLRGYGIGGVGNIRRPTEVIHFSSRRVDAMTLFSSVAPAGTERKRWNLMNLLGRRGDRKAKEPATP